MKKLVCSIVIGIAASGAQAQQNTFPSSGNVAIGTTTPLALLSVGPQDNLANNAVSMIVGSPVLGTNADAMNYVAEFRSNSGNIDRLLVGEHRTSVGNDWYTGAWRIQPAVDGAFTGVNGNKGYMELSFGDHGAYRGVGLSGSGNTFPDAVVGANGSVGIGVTAPAEKLEVSGNLKISGGGAHIIFSDGSVQDKAWNGTLCGGDYAESVDVSGKRTQYEPGDVLVIDPAQPGKFLKSNQAYSKLVTGVYSTKPGVVGRRQTGITKDQEVPMAMIGIVPIKVTTENGKIEPGDLLVTASTMGYAMKGTDSNRMFGATVGKALGTLKTSTGVIEAVITLQ